MNRYKIIKVLKAVKASQEVHSGFYRITIFVTILLLFGIAMVGFKSFLRSNSPQAITSKISYLINVIRISREIKKFDNLRIARVEKKLADELEKAADKNKDPVYILNLTPSKETETHHLICGEKIDLHLFRKNIPSISGSEEVRALPLLGSSKASDILTITIGEKSSSAPLNLLAAAIPTLSPEAEYLLTMVKGSYKSSMIDDGRLKHYFKKNVINLYRLKITRKDDAIVLPDFKVNIETDNMDEIYIANSGVNKINCSSVIKLHYIIFSGIDKNQRKKIEEGETEEYMASGKIPIIIEKHLLNLPIDAMVKITAGARAFELNNPYSLKRTDLHEDKLSLKTILSSLPEQKIELWLRVIAVENEAE